MNVRVRIGLLGTMSVLIDCRPLPKTRSRKTKWLLALLALRGGKPISRVHVAGMLWPDTESVTALANLRSVMSDLRQAMGDEAVRLQTPDRRTIVFDLEGIEIDLASFDTAIQAGDLEAAVNLYPGPLLQDCDEEWIVPERNLRERQCLAALHDLAARTEVKKAIEWAQRAVAIAPWQDSAHRDLMSAHTRADDLNAALTVYRDFAQALRSETGGAPEPQTTELYTRIRSGQLAATKPCQTPKPLPTTSFIGREDELLELAQEIRSHRLVTLLGEGGIGKTRLAQEVFRELYREFSDGVYFVWLEAVQGKESLLYAISATLPHRPSAKTSPLEGLLVSLRSKRLLLVLDNCEHLLPACAKLVKRLMEECSQLHILATSREPLGLVGESAWSVPALTVPDPRHLPEQSGTLLRVLMGYESVRLFVDRAHAASRSFELTRENAAAIAELCAILEGSPLAIELAAGRARTMSVPDILARFRRDRLDFLSAPRRAEAARHQNLRRALDWSYSLLEPDERRTFARLAIFAGGWTLEAAEAVGDISALALESLVEKSLVKFNPQGRYSFLETVRQYAAERLAESSEAPRLERRHSEYFALLAERLTSAKAPATALDVELGNFNAALDRADGDPEITLRLATALCPHWELTFSRADGRRRLEKALERFPSAQSSLRALAVYRLASLRLGDDLTAAIALFEESLAMRRQLGESEAIAHSLYGLARAWFYAADYNRAALIADECISVACECGDKNILAGGKGLRSFLHLLAGEYARAKKLGTEGLFLVREISNQKNVGGVLRTLGTLAYELGDYDLYRKHNEEALAIYRSIDHEDGVAWCLIDLGKAATDLGQVAMGRELLEQALEISRRLNDRYCMATALETLGFNDLAQQNIEGARRFFEEALSAFRTLEDRNGVARAMDGLGDAASETEAYAYYREALLIWGEINQSKRIRDSFLRIGDGGTNRERSIRLWAKAHRMGEMLGVPLPLPMQARHERAIQEAKRDPKFYEYWAAGEAMTLDKALDLALNQ